MKGLLVLVVIVALGAGGWFILKRQRVKHLKAATAYLVCETPFLAEDAPPLAKLLGDMKQMSINQLMNAPGLPAMIQTIGQAAKKRLEGGPGGPEALGAGMKLGAKEFETVATEAIDDAAATCPDKVPDKTLAGVAIGFAAGYLSKTM